MFDHVLSGRSVQDIDDFKTILTAVDHDTPSKVLGISTWLNAMFGKLS